jgi:hypothetical protein
MALPRRVKPVLQLSGTRTADARMSHRGRQILDPKVRVPHRTRPLATKLKPFASTSAEHRRMPRSPDQAAVHQTHRLLRSPVQLGSVRRRDRGVDCGDGRFACPSGFTFRASTVSRPLRRTRPACTSCMPRGCRAGRARSSCATRRTGDGWSTPATTLVAVPTGHYGHRTSRPRRRLLDSRGDPGYAAKVSPGNTAAGANSGDLSRYAASAMTIAVLTSGCGSLVSNCEQAP